MSSASAYTNLPCNSSRIHFPVSGQSSRHSSLTFIHHGFGRKTEWNPRFVRLVLLRHGGRLPYGKNRRFDILLGREVVAREKIDFPSHLIERHGRLHETDDTVTEAVVQRSILSRRKPWEELVIEGRTLLCFGFLQCIVEMIGEEEMSNLLAFE